MTRIFNVDHTITCRKTGHVRKTSIILIDTHPLEWACNPPPLFHELFVTAINSWTEVDPRDVERLLPIILSQEILNFQDGRMHA